MRILSKFQDFYDSALAYGFENDRLYHRQNRVWNTSDRPAPVLSPLMAELHRVANQAPTVGCLGTRMFGYRPKDHHLEVTPLVFCVGGVIHQAVWILHVRSKRLNAFSRGWKENNAIPSQQVHDKDVDRSTPFEAHPADTVLWNGPVFDVAEYQEALRPWHAVVQLSASEKQRKVVHGKDLERIEEWLKQAPPNVMDLALTERIPVAMAAQGVVSESPRLADWKFGRRMDASTLMQELSMFVGNMALNQEPPVEVEDKYRVLGHGFNEQSFRKQPTKHGLPKRAKRPHPDTPVKDNTGVDSTPSTEMEKLMFLVPFALVWLLFSAFLTSFSTWALGWPSPLPSLGLDAWWGTFVFLTGFAGLMSLFGFVLMGVLMLMETSRHRSPYA